MEDLSAQLMAIFVPAIVAVVGILVAWGLAELRKLIKAKTDSTAAVQAFDTVADLVHSTVSAINQTTRKTFEDGKLSESEKRAYKKMASNLVINQLPAATKKILDRSVNDLTVYVDNRIEQTVVYENRATNMLIHDNRGVQIQEGDIQHA